MTRWTSGMAFWLRGKLRNVGFLRASYHWLMARKYRDWPRRLAHAVFVFLMAAMYFLLLTPYAIACRLLRRSPLRSSGGWRHNPQTTADTGLFGRMV